MKKVISFLLSFAVLISSCSCGQNNNSSNSDSSNIENVMQITQTIYKEEVLVTPDDCQMVQKIYYIPESEKYYIIFRSTQGEIKISVLNSNFETENNISLGKPEQNSQSYYYANPDGTITEFLYTIDYDYPENGQYDEEDFLQNAKISFKMKKYDVAGNIIFEKDMPDMNQCYNINVSRFSGVVSDGDGYILNIHTGLVKIDFDGNVLNSTYDDKHDFLGIDSNGKILCASIDSISYLDENKLAPYSQSIPTDKYLYINNNPEAGRNGYKIYLQMNEGYFGLTDDNKFVKILDYNTSNIVSSEVIDVVAGSKGKFLMYSISNDGSEYISKLTVRPDDYVENKKTVVLGIEDSSNDAINQIISRFNKQSDDYKIECKSYGGDYDKFNKDLISGESPDLFMYRQTSSMYRYANNGVFDDMYEYIENYNSENGFKKDDILDNVIDALEYKGGLYGICSSFKIDSLFANSDVIGKEYTNWSYQDMYDITENMPNNMVLSNSIAFNTRLDVFNFLGAYYSTNWIDYVNAKCDFTSEKFLKFLEFCHDVQLQPELDYASMTSEEVQMVNQQNYNMLKNKEALFGFDYMNSIKDVYSRIEQNFLPDNNVTLLGLPSDNNSGYISPSGNMYSIINNGDCKEGAWAFINYIMSEPYQDKVAGDWGLLVTRKDSFEKGIKRCISLPEFDGYIHRYSICDASNEFVEYFFDYVGQCNNLVYQNGYITYIMDEEFNEFINNNISAEECAERIQSRVSIYLSEQY